MTLTSTERSLADCRLWIEGSIPTPTWPVSPLRKGVRNGSAAYGSDGKKLVPTRRLEFTERCSGLIGNKVHAWLAALLSLKVTSHKLNKL